MGGASLLRVKQKTDLGRGLLSGIRARIGIKEKGRI
jgi:hypothetical protein